MKVKDTGDRTVFKTGSHKDLAVGRGRFDLLPLRTLGEIYKTNFYRSEINDFLQLINDIMFYPNVGVKREVIGEAIQLFVNKFLEQSIEHVTIKLAKLYEAGAIKYAERDWEKGRPMEVFINSTLRHFFQYLAGETDEDHGIAVVWNLLSCSDTIYRFPSLAYTAPRYKEALDFA